MNRRLSILIATLGRRNGSFLKLMEQLAPQIERNNIEVIAYWNNGEKSIGEIRQALLEEAAGEYVCFIDDDDMVPDWYCDEIFYNLGEDYVGFKLELYERQNETDWKLLKPVHHSIRYGVWHEDDKGFYRGITHLNPIKRELALLGNFGTQGLGEDESWARSVAPHVRTEKFIDMVMYYYRHDAKDTSFGGAEQPRKPYKRPVFEHPQFRFHPASKLKGVHRNV
jgi:hypothetical protein